MKYLVIIVLLGYIEHYVAQTVEQQVDYCAPAYMCGSRHILACNHTGAFDPRCPPNAEMLPMTEELKNLFIDEHNKYRNEFAEGLIFKPAAAMATLEWDEEMANLAVFNVKQCGIIYEDQKCLTCGPYNQMDQNIGILYLKSKFNRSSIYSEIKEEMRKYWYEQYHDCTQEDIDSYKPPGIKLILHFGKMMLDRNNRIGCAASLYEGAFGIQVLFTCNYARRLFCYKPIFRSGEYAGSKCTTGMNPRYPFLCSTKEYFDVNDYNVTDTVEKKVDYCAPAYMCGSRHILACNHTGIRCKGVSTKSCHGEYAVMAGSPRYISVPTNWSIFDIRAFDPRCPPDAEMLPMTEELKTLFIDEHNKYRNEFAEGLIFKPAAAMATLEWDEEMANLAVFNVKQCGIIYEDQKCLTCGPYNQMDQNIGRVFYLKSKFNRTSIYSDIKEEMRKYWYEQYRDCTQEDVDSYKPPGIKLILHFGKMMLDRNNRIGCAASLYEGPHGIDVLFTCNYARRLFCYKPIFRSGEYAGSKCTTGMNPRYPFLCSTNEYFNVNDYSV